MNPQDMIERYVHAVARRLPIGMRSDVAAELRELIRDGAAAGGEQSAADYLISLGPPAQFALRYSAPPPIIEPLDARLFAKLAIGLTLALAILAVAALLSPADESSVNWQAAADAVRDAFLAAALQILGLLVLVFWLVGVARRRVPGLFRWKPQALPPARDPDAINRPAAFAALAAWAAGFLVLMQPFAAFDWMSGGHAPPVLRDVFAYDPVFLRERAPILWGLLALTLLVFAWAGVEGRWSRRARRGEQMLGVAIAMVSFWAVLAGDIFVAAPPDQAMKFAMTAFGGFALVDAWQQVRRGLWQRAARAGGF